MDVDGDGQSDLLLVAAPMYYKKGWEGGKVYVYSVTPEVRLPDTFNPRTLAPFSPVAPTAALRSLEPLTCP